jgi:hypothetical protein
MCAVASIRSKLIGISVAEAAAFLALQSVIQATDAIQATAQVSKVRHLHIQMLS